MANHLYCFVVIFFDKHIVIKCQRYALTVLRILKESIYILLIDIVFETLVLSLRKYFIYTYF